MSETSLPPSSQDDAPIDAEFEPATPHEEPAAKTASGPGWTAFCGLGSVSLFALCLAAASAGYVPGFKPGSSALSSVSQDVEELKSQNEAVSTISETLTANIATLQSRADSLRADRTRSVTDIRGLRSELETLKADISTLQRARIARLAESDDASNATSAPADLSPLEARVASLEDALVSQLGAYDVTLENLKSRLDALEAQAQSDSLIASNSSNARTEAALALSSIEASARRGRPFLSAHQKLASAMPANQAVQRLASIAPNPIPTLSELRAAFPALKIEALNQDAASQGGATGWMRDLFGDGIQVRQTGQVTTGDQLRAAETALQTGDLRNAIETVRALDLNLQPVFTDWLDNADDRLLLEETLEALRLTMIAEERP